MHSQSLTAFTAPADCRRRVLNLRRVTVLMDLNASRPPVPTATRTDRANGHCRFIVSNIPHSSLTSVFWLIYSRPVPSSSATRIDSIQTQLPEGTPSFVLGQAHKSYKHQFSNLYFARLTFLKKLVEKKAKEKWRGLSGRFHSTI